MSFDTYCIDLIITCVSTTPFATLIEGSPIEEFKAKWGIRKGDPIFPLIFIIVLDFFGMKVEEDIIQEELDLFSMGGCVVDLYLAFADDLIFFPQCQYEINRKAKVNPQ